MTKHTKGEWDFFLYPIIRNEYGVQQIPIHSTGVANIAFVHASSEPGFDYDECVANARLISAAPDLLEALLFINQEWGNFLAKTNIRTSFYSARELRFMNEMELKMAAAIAKATASKDHTQPNNQKSASL